MRRLRIRLRLTAWYVLVLAAVLVALTAFVVTRLRSDLTSEMDRSLNASADQIRRGYAAEGRAEFLDTARTVLPGSRAERSGAQLLDARDAVLLGQGEGVTRTPLIGPATVAQAVAGRTVVLSRRVGAPPEHVRILAMGLRRGQRAEVIVVAESLSEIDQAISRVRLLLLAGGAAALAVVAVGGWWIARKALRPVEQMTRRADAIGLDDVSGRIAGPEADDELGHLASTLNAMLARLETGIQARQRLVADASHELRAPLAAMRTELEVSLRHDAIGDEARATLASAREEVVRMSRIVDDLLTLARVDEGHFALVDGRHELGDIARRAVRPLRASAAARGVDLVVRGGPAEVDGDGDRLEQVVGNLVDNAIRFAPPGSEVTVAVWREGDEAGVRVSDAGPGVTAEARERIFERFGREDPSRGRAGGAGLGLAICNEIVRAHDGRIRVEDREPRGSVFVVSLPRSGPHPELSGAAPAPPASPVGA